MHTQDAYGRLTEDQRRIVELEAQLREMESNRVTILAMNDAMHNALEQILQSAGYTSGQCEPTLRELNVSVQALDAARLALRM